MMRYRSNPEDEFDGDMPELFWMSPEDLQAFDDVQRLARGRGPSPDFEMNPTWARLRDGSWGVRGTGAAPRPGAQVTATSRDGRSKTVTIGRVLASDGQSWLATVDQGGGGSSSYSGGGGGGGYRGGARRGGRYECPECGDYVTPGTQCWETGATH